MPNSIGDTPSSRPNIASEKNRNQQLTDDETFLLDLSLSLGILLVIVCRHVAEILLVYEADVESSVWVVVRKRQRPRWERSRLRRSSYRFAFKMYRWTEELTSPTSDKSANV